MSSTATVTILVTDINDEAPVFSETSAFRVKEVNYSKYLFYHYAVCKILNEMYSFHGNIINYTFYIRELLVQRLARLRPSIVMQIKTQR